MKNIEKINVYNCKPQIFFIKWDLKRYELYGRVNIVYGWYTKTFYLSIPPLNVQKSGVFFPCKPIILMSELALFGPFQCIIPSLVEPLI